MLSDEQGTRLEDADWRKITGVKFCYQDFVLKSFYWFLFSCLVV
jgi:hypothetical protein